MKHHAIISCEFEIRCALQFYRRCAVLARIKAVNDTIAALENYHEIEEAVQQEPLRWISVY